MESDNPAETHQPVSEWSGMKRLHDCTVQQQQTLSAPIIRGHSHWYGWSGFNWTTFEATTTFLPIFTNSAARPADQLAATRPQLTEPEIDSLKATLPNLQSAKVSWDPILITEKWRWKNFPRFCAEGLALYMHLYSGARRQRHPLLQPYHFKSHGYSLVTEYKPW